MNTPTVRETNPMALISLICGILGWIIFPVIASLIAVITGHKARREIRAQPGRYEGDTMAVIGLLLGYANLVIALLGILFLAVIFLFFGGLAWFGINNAG
ncbi:hypothetical protein CO610_01790 [Lysobacteraceae bacterium NML95-0200]|nr:hypothetical protein CO610_01790 [Xanthomonadaceae bacterium NML95-0200]